MPAQRNEPVSARTIVIVEDQQMFRELMRSKCQHEYGYTVVSAVATGEEGRKLCLENPPDVLLLDIHLLDIDGVDLTVHLKKTLPRMRILLISSECSEATLKRIALSPADGYIDKNESLHELSHALDEVIVGRKYYSRVFREVQRTMQTNHNAWTKILSKTEMLLLPRLCCGLGPTEIAAELAMNTETILWHRKNIMKKLTIETQQELMHYGLTKGFVTLDNGQVLPVNMPVT